MFILKIIKIKIELWKLLYKLRFFIFNFYHFSTSLYTIIYNLLLFKLYK